MALSIREALGALIGMETDPRLVDLALISLGLDGAQDYTTDENLQNQLVQAEIFVLSRMSVTKSFSEGDMTITYDLNAINQRLAKLNPAPAVEEAKPTIRNATYKW